MITVRITPETPSHMLRAIRAACNELLGETHADLTAQAAQHNSRAEELRVASESETDKAAAALTAHNAADPYSVAEVAKIFGVSEDCVSASGIEKVRAIVAAEEKLFVEGEKRSAPPAGLLAIHDVDAEREDAESVIAITEAAARYAAATAVELDSAGQPWNAELHSSSRAKIADGTWKKRRNSGSNLAAQAQEAAEDSPSHPVALSAPPVPPAPAVPTAEPIMPKIFALITSQIVTINQAVEAAQAEGYADLGANGLGGAPREAQEAVLRKLEGE